MTIKIILGEITEIWPGTYQAAVPDEDPTHPRQDCRLITTIQTWDDGYQISDQNQYDTPGEFMLGIMLDEPFEKLLLDNMPSETRDWEQVPTEIRDQVTEMGGYPGAIGNIRLEKATYDQSKEKDGKDQEAPDLRLTLEPFSYVLKHGQVGWIHIRTDRMEEFNMTQERATQVMENNLQELQDHINKASRVTILMRKTQASKQGPDNPDATIYRSTQATKTITKRMAKSEPSPAGV